MKKFYIFSFVIILVAMLLCGCAQKAGKLTPIYHIEDSSERVEAPVEEMVDTIQGQYEQLAEESSSETSDEKMSRLLSYYNFYGNTMDILASGENESIINFKKFLNLAGLDYGYSEDEIIITPRNYAKETDFVLILKMMDLPSIGQIVDGSTLKIGLNDDNSWKEEVEFDSATDAIYGAVLDEKVFLIGADQFDYLWRTIRVLTAPADKLDEINKAIDEEFASYYYE